MRKRALIVGRCLAGILLAACSRPDLPILDRPTSDGIPLRRLVAGHGATVLLVYDPSDVFACGASISEWLSWGRGNPGRLVLALSRAPSRAEAKQLLTYRVGATIVLARPERGRTSLRSTEFLVVDGKVVRTQVVSTRVLRSPLLKYALTLPDAGPSRALGLPPTPAAKEER